MPHKDGAGRNTSRRNAIKTLGSTAFLVTTSVSAKDSRTGPGFQKILDQSHRVLQVAGVKKQHKFLRNHGIATALDSVTYQMPTHYRDGPSTQILSENEISLWFSLYHDCDTASYPNGTYVAELSWEYSPSFNDYGSPPHDYVGIGWDNNTWYYEDNNVGDMYSNSGYIDYYSGSSGNGPAWEVNDWYAIDNGIYGDGQDYYYVGVHLDWNGTDDEKESRTIAASYTHTWSEVTVTGVSVSFPAGVSVSVSDEQKRWEKGKNDHGEFLRLRYNDLGSCY